VIGALIVLLSDTCLDFRLILHLVLLLIGQFIVVHENVRVRDHLHRIVRIEARNALHLLHVDGGLNLLEALTAINTCLLVFKVQR